MRLRADQGFAMFTVVGVMMVLGIAAALAYQVVEGDRVASARNVDDKQALAVAEAGIQAYAYQLSVNRDLWRYCHNTAPYTGGLISNPVVPRGDGGQWNVPPSDVATKAPSYRIEILPANGAANCVPDNLASVMGRATQTMRIRVTGRAYTGGARKTLIASFHKPTLAKFVYFTESESGGPTVLRDDVFQGSVYTRNTFELCGTPTFGRGSVDTIEVGSRGTSGRWYSQAPGCSGYPSDRARVISPAPQRSLPTTTANLKAQAATALRFIGATRLRFSGGGVWVTGRRESGGRYNDQFVSVPNGSLIYVSNDNCATTYSFNRPYARAYDSETGCAVVRVEGTYSRDVSVFSESDILLTGAFTATGSAKAGLMAQNNVRIFNPMQVVGPFNGSRCNLPWDYTGLFGGPGGKHSGVHDASAPRDFDVEASIMALTGSLVSDNYWCGKQHILTLRGTLLQKTSGKRQTDARARLIDPPGTGYSLHATIDEELEYHQPPHFLAPEDTAWDMKTVQEQVPAQ